MRNLSLIRDTPARISRDGASLRIVNHPTAGDPSRNKSLQGIAFPSAWLFIGFDRTPTSAAFDSCVPPFSEAIIPVPSTVKNVFVTWSSVSLSNFYGSLLAAPSLNIQALYEWSDCEQPPTIRALDVVAAPVNSFYFPWRDFGSAMWHPSQWTSVLNQGLTTVDNPGLRPRVVPSLSVTVTGPVLANTLTLLPAAVSAGTGFGVNLLKLIISVSVAGLVVVGRNSLTIGAPGASEVVRINALVAGVQPPIDFGEGLDLGNNAETGTWKYYASVGMTVDMTILLG